eukprot:5766456-Amphidinium_carterae.1
MLSLPGVSIYLQLRLLCKVQLHRNTIVSECARQPAQKGKGPVFFTSKRMELTMIDNLTPNPSGQLNVRTAKLSPQELSIWNLTGKTRIMGIPDVSYKIDPDHSSQRGQVIFLCKARPAQQQDAVGSLIDYESHKIKRTVLKTVVAE